MHVCQYLLIFLYRVTGCRKKWRAKKERKGPRQVVTRYRLLLHPLQQMRPFPAETRNRLSHAVRGGAELGGRVGLFARIEMEIGRYLLFGEGR